MEALRTSSSSTSEGQRIAALQSLLDEANRLKDRYQADYMEAHRARIVLQTRIDRVLDCGDESAATAELRLRFEEVLAERDGLLEEKEVIAAGKKVIEKELNMAKIDCEWKCSVEIWLA
jgi:protein HOOK3